MRSRVTAILLPAVAYIIIGKLSHLLVLPPGYPSVIWPPAGVALAALLLMGYRAGLGVGLGACLLLLWRTAAATGALPGADALPVAIGVGFGAAVQATLGAWLIRRHIGSPGALDNARDAALFLALGGVVACLVNPCLGTGLLLWVGWIEPHGLLESVGLWWLGDFIGVILVAPVIFTFFAEPRRLWRNRRGSVALPLMGCLALAIVSFVVTSRGEAQRIVGALEQKATRIAGDVALQLAPPLERMHAVDSLLRLSQESSGRASDEAPASAGDLAGDLAGGPAGDPIDDATLARFAALLEERQTEIPRVQWRARGVHARAGATAATAEDLDLLAARVHLVTRNEQGVVVVAETVGAIPGGLAAARRALASGAPAITAPMELRTGSGMQRGLLAFWPVLAGGPEAESGAERRQRLRGFIAGPVLVDALMERVLRQMDMHGLAVRLHDRTGQTGPGRASPLYAQEPAGALEPRLRAATDSTVAGRLLSVEIVPTRAAVRRMRAWYAPALLVLDLLIAALLGTLLLLVTGYSARLEARAEAQAEELGEARVKLQEAQFLHTLVESDIIGILVTDTKGGIHHANDAFLDMIGYTREDFERGQIRWDTLTPPEHEEMDRIAVAQLVATGTTPTWEKEYTRKDGTRVPVMLGVAVADAREDRQVCFVVDLSKVKEAEAELARQAAELERYKVIVNSAPASIFVKEYSEERDGVYILANPRASDIISVYPIIGCDDDDWLVPEVAAQLQAQDRRILASGEHEITEDRLVDLSSGEPTYYLTTRVPLVDADGKPYAIAGIAIDTTQQKLANDRLEAANEELRAFAYVASHDLQEPLRTVRSFVELLERRYADAFDDKGRRWLAFIVSGVQRMRALIDDLLLYSRVGRMGKVEEVDIGMLVREVLEDAEASIEDAGAEIEVGEMPSFLVNRTELRQVFQNLVSNAVKFRRSDVTPRVEITAARTPHGWAFEVADNGIGIEPAYHERIFLVFQRLHGRDAYAGTGIGLALVKKIVERQGGEVSVRSIPGQGSVFRFVMPLRPLLAAGGQEVGAPGDVPGHAPDETFDETSGKA